MVNVVDDDLPTQRCRGPACARAQADRQLGERVEQRTFQRADGRAFDHLLLLVQQHHDGANVGLHLLGEIDDGL